MAFYNRCLTGPVGWHHLLNISNFKKNNVPKLIGQSIFNAGQTKNGE
jgi:hypothetical protein